MVIDAEDIRQSGYSGTEQLLQSLPQNFRGGDAGASADVNMSLGSQRGFNATAGSGVNLRGLGSNATLVLVNGRRMAASSAGTFTDISLIPLDAIERIEILTDGASAIYGADAVAGVVNIVLKRDYTSAETRLSRGFTTQGGRDEYRVSHSFGKQWNGGSAMVSADYLNQGQLLSSQRSFTSAVPTPTSIYPTNEMASLVFSANQKLGEKLTSTMDFQYSHADRHLISTGATRTDNYGKPIRRNVLLSLEYQAPGDWFLTLDGFASDEDSKNRQVSYRANGEVGFTFNQTRNQDQRGAELRANGSLFELPAGPMKIALGGSYKEDGYKRTVDLYRINQSVSRENTAIFAEVHAPLVAEGNAFPGVRRLDLSVAVRHDDYSDFGTTTNPRVGLSWSPAPGLTLRSSYSTSFRAPAIGEEVRFGASGITGLEITPFLAPDGTGEIPVVMLLGSEPLRPEEATNWTYGVDWRPKSIPGLAVGMSYYDIDYSERIVLPPLDYGALANPALAPFIVRYDSPDSVRALVERYVAQGAYLVDFTDDIFGPDPLSQATTVYKYLWTNASKVRVSGFDLNVDYPFEMGDNSFEVRLNANYIRQMLNSVTPTALPYDLVGTFANPPKLRMRGSLSWSRGSLSSILTANYAHSYTDTAGLVDRPVDSYTTIDAVARYSFASADNALSNGLSLSLNAINLFDEKPPYVALGGRGANYDAANASPLGRMVSLQIAKRW
jgi:outer membrane receptor protein involved in Fe transport